jgi:hypothetical protein
LSEAFRVTCRSKSRAPAIFLCGICRCTEQN